MWRPPSQSPSQLDRSVLNSVGDEECDINLYNYQKEIVEEEGVLETHESDVLWG